MYTCLRIVAHPFSQRYATFTHPYAPYATFTHPYASLGNLCAPFAHPLRFMTDLVPILLYYRDWSPSHHALITWWFRECELVGYRLIWPS